MDPKILESCHAMALAMRKDILTMTMQAGASGGHLGGSLSLVEILVVLSKIMHFDPQNPSWPLGDRLILSKGHGVTIQVDKKSGPKKVI